MDPCTYFKIPPNQYNLDTVTKRFLILCKSGVDDNNTALIMYGKAINELTSNTTTVPSSTSSSSTSPLSSNGSSSKVPSQYDEKIVQPAKKNNMINNNNINTSEESVPIFTESFDNLPDWVHSRMNDPVQSQQKYTSSIDDVDDRGYFACNGLLSVEEDNPYGDDTWHLGSLVHSNKNDFKLFDDYLDKTNRNSPSSSTCGPNTFVYDEQIANRNIPPKQKMTKAQWEQEMHIENERFRSQLENEYVSERQKFQELMTIGQKRQSFIDRNATFSNFG